MRCCPKCEIETSEKECWLCGSTTRIGTLVFWMHENRAKKITSQHLGDRPKPVPADRAAPAPRPRAGAPRAPSTVPLHRKEGRAHLH